ncbi:hypothetical protein LguiB_017994 [Lonicera macranthoides]
MKGDVYSYDVLLMETLTRKKPTDEMFSDEMAIRRQRSFPLRLVVAHGERWQKN